MLLVPLALGLGGCSTLAYYGQAVAGHLEIVQRARPVADWLADPRTPPALRTRLELSQRVRDFAVAELKLPDNRSYRTYADLGRDAAVYNVVAAPELSLTLKTWCFPIMGCVGYRGYFARDAADREASHLRSEGWETSVYGVPAYSTLGKTAFLGGDPLLSTFINGPRASWRGSSSTSWHIRSHTPTTTRCSTNRSPSPSSVSAGAYGWNNTALQRRVRPRRCSRRGARSSVRSPRATARRW